MDFDGLLGTRASLMLDVVFVAMFVVLPVMAWSIQQARRGKYQLHKQVQLVLAAVLLVTVVLFEVDMRLAGWEHRANPAGPVRTAVYASLYVHLVFAVSTALLWVYVVVQALRKIPSPPGPSPYSRTHIFWARLAAWDMALTSVTGWVFYVVAFILPPS